MNVFITDGELYEDMTNDQDFWKKRAEFLLENILKEKIACAAIQKDGVNYAGKRHNDVIRESPEFGFFKSGECIQGFMTTRGRFVDRIEGLKIAEDAQQIIEKHGNKSILYSEDIY